MSRIAVALHDVEPRNFARCALIRDWLADLGVARATLLVIPAPDLHPFDDRCPELAAWLAERLGAGDAVAQHGFQHRQTRPGSAARQWMARRQGGDAAEFVGLQEPEARQAVRAGLRVLRLAGVQPAGFVAPAYAYTPGLAAVLAQEFRWWATLRAVHRAGDRAARTPALCLGTSSATKRATSPLLVRLGARATGELLRLDLHPADLDHRGHVRALEGVLRRARRREAVTYDDLAAA